MGSERCDDITSPRHRSHSALLDRHARKATSRANHYSTKHPPTDLPEVGLYVDDLVVAVPSAGEEVLLAIRLEANGAVDEAVLVGTGVVPERVRIPEAEMRRVLERASAVGAGRLRQ